MNEAFKTILIQALGYLVATIIGVGILALLQRRFFWKYIKVRASLGRLKLVVIEKKDNTKDYAVGEVEGDSLVFRHPVAKSDVRLTIPDDNVFTYSIGVWWVYIDDKDSSIITPSGEKITTHDPVKENAMMSRAYQLGKLKGTMDIFKILIVIAIIGAIGGGVAAYFSFNTLNSTSAILTACEAAKAACETGIVVATGG